LFFDNQLKSLPAYVANEREVSRSIDEWHVSA